MTGRLPVQELSAQQRERAVALHAAFDELLGDGNGTVEKSEVPMHTQQLVAHPRVCGAAGGS